MVTRQDFDRIDIDEEFYTVDEIAEKFKLHKQTIYSMCHDKRLPSDRIGNAVRIPRSGLQQFFDGVWVNPSDR